MDKFYIADKIWEGDNFLGFVLHNKETQEVKFGYDAEVLLEGVEPQYTVYEFENEAEFFDWLNANHPAWR